MIKSNSIGLKWPNDMLFDKKKIGGILVIPVDEGESQRMKKIIKLILMQIRTL